MTMQTRLDQAHDAAAGAVAGVRRWAVVAIVGQSLFPLAWLVAGGIDRGYSHEKQYVSELAAGNAAHPWIVEIGIALLALSWIALGLALRAGLPSRPWSWLPVGLFLATGVATALVALMPLDCSASVDHACRARLEHWQLSWHHYGHDFLGWASQLMLAATPFALARALRPGILSRLALGLGLIGLLIGAGGVIAPIVDQERAGIYQRAGLIVVQGWTYLIAAALILAATTRPPGFGRAARTGAAPDPRATSSRRRAPDRR
jgi:uncharacterized protein DUF998